MGLVVEMERVYVCIDLKSFYASVECIERGLDPLTTNLVVADSSRTEKTICLAISPSLKQYGLGGRARLFEVVQKVKEINYQRKRENNYRSFTGKSWNDLELKQNSRKELDFIIAPPRMAYYMNYSTKIYNIYLKHIAPEDIFVYSIDEVFCDITNYLKYDSLTPKEFVTNLIKEVYEETGITATAGIGPNLFLAKVAMDVVAKHQKANAYGVRIAELDEMTYRKELWHHQPITDIWRVGRGIAKKLKQYHIYTMGDIARCSIENEDLLYRLFGVNAEILIDHAWGYEPCTMKTIKNYQPTSQSIHSGQVLSCPYNYEKTKLIVREMADLLALDLVSKKLVTDQLTLTIGYDVQNITDRNIPYDGEVVTDMYGRKIPKHAHGTIHLDHKTSSSKEIMKAMTILYHRITNRHLLVKRINMSAVHVTNESLESKKTHYEQLELFTSTEEQSQRIDNQRKEEQEERGLQEVLLNIKEKYGKNAILKGMNLKEGATTRERNMQIGGHHA